MRALVAPILPATLLLMLLASGCREPAPPAPPQLQPRASSRTATPPTTDGVPLEPGGVPAPLAFVHKGDIYLAIVGEATAKPLTHFGNCRCPAWSRDGTQLAFVRDHKDMLDTGAGEAPAGEVWLCKADGSGARKLAESAKDRLGPGISGLAWDCDDKGIVAMAGLAATSGGLWHIALDGTVTGGKQGANMLQAVASGFAIAEHNYTRGYGAEEVFVIDGNLKQTGYATEMTDLFPVFSLDCALAAVVNPDNPKADKSDQKDCITLIAKPAFADAGWLEKNAKGDAAEGKIADPNGLPTRAVKAYESALPLGSLAFSPDGRRLAFVAEPRPGNEPSALAQVWLLDLRTREASLTLRDGAEPAWQPAPSK